ncbi:hypothetical protein ACFXKR_17925 [Streptomyces violascens]|uniref:hypothetical protein n=1 Tax=Streptomyces violascens TaxID=67381 RepID=UPI0036CA5833
MRTMTPDPLAVLQVAEMHDITEEQAATAINWAAHMTVHAWESYADTFGLVKKDGDAMVAWHSMLDPDLRSSVLDDAVTAVVGADAMLAEIHRTQDSQQPARARVMRTNRPRVRIH